MPSSGARYVIYLDPWGEDIHSGYLSWPISDVHAVHQLDIWVSVFAEGTFLPWRCTVMERFFEPLRRPLDSHPLIS